MLTALLLLASGVFADSDQIQGQLQDEDSGIDQMVYQAVSTHADRYQSRAVKENGNWNFYCGDGTSARNPDGTYSVCEVPANSGGWVTEVHNPDPANDVPDPGRNPARTNPGDTAGGDKSAPGNGQPGPGSGTDTRGGADPKAGGDPTKSLTASDISIPPGVAGQGLSALLSGNQGVATDKYVSGTSCPYSDTSALKRKIQQEYNRCQKAVSMAAASCTAGSNKGIQAALNAAQQAAQMVAGASGGSLSDACNNYNATNSNLGGALDQYRESCVPAKTACENSCLSVARTVNNAIKTSTKVEKCISPIEKIKKDLEGVRASSQANLVKCRDFGEELKTSYADSKILEDSMNRNSNCKQISEKCQIDPNTGQCTNLSVSQVGEQAPLETVSQNLREREGEAWEEGGAEGGAAALRGRGGYRNGDGYSNVSQKSLGSTIDQFGADSPASANGAQGVSGDQRQIKKKSFSRGSRNYRSAGGSFKSFKLGKGRSLAAAKGAGEDGGAGGEGADGDASGLEKFLPGGAMDPNAAKFPDGITGATGPGIFEKVSRRYQLHEPKLMTFPVLDH